MKDLRDRIPWTTLGFAGVFIALASLFFYMRANRIDYIDTDYNFQFATLDGWSMVEPVGESYLAFATTSGETLRSYAELRIVPHQGVPLEDLKPVLEESCTQTAQSLEASSSAFTEVSWSNVRGYRCTLTAIDPNSGLEITTQTDNVYKTDGGEYDYVLTIAWPNQYYETEQAKIDALRSGFSVR